MLENGELQSFFRLPGAVTEFRQFVQLRGKSVNFGLTMFRFFYGSGQCLDKKEGRFLHYFLIRYKQFMTIVFFFYFHCELSHLVLGTSVKTENFRLPTFRLFYECVQGLT